ncbi:MAG TPA: cell division protein CrgA [Acidimicrobiales bacterium]|nr:cell division protein CrgA [Acidimicrobiales bacterium]
MARKTKDARPGRVTPKGGPPRRKVAGGAAAPATESGRYTAPIPREFRVSPWWVPALMIGFFVAGVLIILLNYLSLLGGSANNVFLFVGLGLIVAGFITSTRWH